MPLCQLYSENNSLVLLIKTMSRHRNCFLSFVATDGTDGEGLKLEKIGPIFSSFNTVSSKIPPKNIMVSSP